MTDLIANLAYHVWLRRFIPGFQKNIRAELKYPDWQMIEWENL